MCIPYSGVIILGYRFVFDNNAKFSYLKFMKVIISEATILANKEKKILIGTYNFNENLFSFFINERNLLNRLYFNILRHIISNKKILIEIWKPSLKSCSPQRRISTISRR